MYKYDLSNFRWSEMVQRNELVRFQLDDVMRTPANNQHQEKRGYRFTINDRSSFFVWCNADIEYYFKII